MADRTRSATTKLRCSLYQNIEYSAKAKVSLFVDITAISISLEYKKEMSISFVTKGDTVTIHTVPASVKWLNAIVVTVYALISILAIRHHEPWADEAQSWLLARDST